MLIAMVRSGQELVSKDRLLRDLSCQVVVPTYTDLILPRNRKSKKPVAVVHPVCPSYIFIEEPANHSRIKQHELVLSVLATGGVLATIDSSLLEPLHALGRELTRLASLHMELKTGSDPTNLKPGDHIVIITEELTLPAQYHSQDRATVDLYGNKITVNTKGVRVLTKAAYDKIQEAGLGTAGENHD